ncbi:SRPBCC domain-containing protein [Amycolatopsis carbonis]|uniref:SRPBCC domain-containing protein n=1 Tax=Amycolatopsis carbonis TaxID=715471 RepID=A0A9Y2IFI9_9PSEU|nr:SRPBCC domain-containing protein [Amycolatopsis sp. 2-15]WIX79430.1 SRPBCC domain-containing protein [Amycolatopsis sp. 2-15]
MTDVKHSTFTLERHYPASPARVFAAWADPAAKASWFGAADHSLDFRVGGRETNRSGDLSFTADYHDIVDGERIVYAGALSGPAGLATVSITTVELVPDGTGTRLVLTEQGTFLDGHEEPAWREQGTGDWLDKLGAHLGTQA